jgi:hypothetical protein
VLLAETIDPDLVTPGPIGFAAIVLVAVATTLLLFDMVRRIRRQKIRAQVEAMLDAEEAAARASKPGSGSKKK